MTNCRDRRAAVRPILALVVLLFAVPATGAEPAAPERARSLHPEFPLRDAAGNRLAAPGPGVSAVGTCGACHDAAFIAAHDSHGAAARTPVGRAALKELAPDCIRCHFPGGSKGLADTILTDEGNVRVAMRPPTPEACGQCHGYVADAKATLAFDEGYLRAAPYGPYGQTLRTGEVFSPQLLSASFLNLADKAAAGRPWDIHAARGLSCTDCHVSPNNPAQTGVATTRRLPHLVRDPRAADFGDYLMAPDHRLVTAECRSCHDPAATHADLPSRERHMNALACQACHVPRIATPTPRVVDATVVTAAGGPRLELRGVESREWDAPSTWYSTGYRPFLLSEPAATAATPSATRLAPYNLVATWEWVDEASSAPVAAEVVAHAWKTSAGAYHPELVAPFDRDGDGRLTDAELVLDSDARVAAIADRIRAAGVPKPAVRATLRAHPVRHGIADGDWVAADCQSCHSAASRLGEDVAVAGVVPGGVVPTPDADAQILLAGRTLETRDGGLVLAGTPAAERYVLGHSRPWSDALGLGVFVMTLLGVGLHGGLRWRSSRRAPAHHRGPTQRVLMYGTYERVWHWLMAFSVVILLLTGLAIHFPHGFGFLAYPTAVFLHNVAAGVFTANAFLSLFYNVATNEIRQFIPQRSGFVGRMLAQVRYYLKGIFARAAHPLAKTPSNKLNPLQQVAYFGLLNVLFPLQILTGALIWASGRWPVVTAPIGGMAVLGPVHNLGSWLFLTFLVMHVYLTTTGHTVTANLKAMIDGWEEVETVPAHAAGEGEGR